MNEQWNASKENARGKKNKLRKPFSKIAQGFKKRTLVTTKLSAKLGISMAQKALKSSVASALGVKKFTGNIEQAVEMADLALTIDAAKELKGEKADKALEAAVEKAWDLFGEMDQLKGLVMKFGQMLSYLSTQMPPEAQRVLAKLQAESSALAFSDIEHVLTEQLNGAVDDIFDRFDREALAAASIGQVHKAVYKGDIVAVKIQYPGVEEAIESDLNLIKGFSPLVSIVKSLLGSSMNTNDLLDELAERVVEECDYELEASVQTLVHTLWVNDPDINIPKVVPDVSSRRIFTSEFVDGLNFYDFKANASQAEKDLAGSTLYRMCFESIFKYCFFNGDPHPGNYIFHDLGKVTFLDFGCVVKFPQPFVQNWKRMARSVFENDRDSFKKYTRLMGFVGNEKKFDWDYHWEFYQYIMHPALVNKPFTYTKGYSDYGDQVLVHSNKNRFSMSLAKQLLFANRLQWGLKNILVDLNATIDVHHIFKELVYGEETEVFNAKYTSD